MHPKLYPWLENEVTPKGVPKGIRTVGDLVKVFHAAPTRNPADPPWVWFGVRANSRTFRVGIETVENALKESEALE